MNIGVISKNSQYKELLEKNELVELAPLRSELKQEYNFSIDIDALLIDGETFSYEQLASVRNVFPEIPVFYKISGMKTHESIRTVQRLCAAHLIKPITEGLTYEQCTNQILQFMAKEKGLESNKVVTFFGTHSGAGVSTTVLNIAEAVSQKAQEKVLVLSLNAWDPSDYFLNYKGKYLNDLKVDLKNKNLTSSNLREALFQHHNFYHLAGNRDIKLQRYFTNEEIEHLIEVAKESFDLILIDGGTHFDTALATQAYVSSNLRFIVTNQEDKGYRGYFPHVFQQLIEPSGGKKSDFMLIINRFQPSMSLINEKDLEEELEIDRLATIPDMDVLGAVSIRQKKLLYTTSERMYTKEIDTIANVIFSEANLTLAPNLEQTNEKKGVLRGIFRKKKEVEKTW
ncbi:ParA family protein [Halobacillus litoralis]|uniref:AAA domain-containing protein n=1 Tax=Halobacillus litoralis TaxID=45668 RepID=A0A410MJF5_9BACI|nr:ParA family protein [Halobacillus litoralis]QAS54820.1 hypothetical protein HLI_21445 [Halobacillus litoralis]